MSHSCGRVVPRTSYTEVSSRRGLPPTAPASTFPPMNPGIRRWARLVVVANIVFVAAWLLAAAWQGPTYSVAAHTISDMYADGAPGAWFLVVTFTLCGAAVLLFAFRSLWPALRAAGWPARVGVILLGLSIFGL